MTGRTTAHISNALDDRYACPERMLGGPKAPLAAESHTAAIGRIARIVEEEGIACDFERLPDYLFLPPYTGPGRDFGDGAGRRIPVHEMKLGRGWRLPDEGRETCVV
jgi:hypothetical protein